MGFDDDSLVRRLESVLYTLDDPGGGFELLREDHFLRFMEPSAPVHYRNGVLRSVFRSEELVSVVRDCISYFGERGLPFRWTVTPSTRPIDTGEILLANGFSHFETLVGMAADSADFAPPERNDIDVVLVDESLAEEWLAILEDAWSLSPSEVPRFRQSLLAGLADPNDFHFIARLDGRPAASAALSLHGDFAHFDGASTCKADRRRGLYLELILVRMAFLRERGIRVATNHCVSTTSAPICERVGFRRICAFEDYIHA